MNDRRNSISMVDNNYFPQGWWTLPIITDWTSLDERAQVLFNVV